MLKNIARIICFATSSVLLTAGEEDPSYPPQYYNLQCDWGLFVTVDFLYWYANESNLVWGSKATVKNFGGIKGAAAPDRHFHFDTEWSPGVRFGIGKNLSCDGWDLFLNWLYIHNTARDSAHFPWKGNPIPDIGQDSIYNPWAYGSWFNESFWENSTASWALNFDLMDFELGRKLWLSPCFILRPFAGLRGTWMHTRTRVETDSAAPGFTQFNPALITTAQFIPFSQASENFIRNNYWGIGLLGGLQPTWAICNNFFIFGSWGGSLVWGRFFGSNVVRAQFQGVLVSPGNEAIPREFSLKNHEKEGFHRIQAMLDLALGIHWEASWFCQRICTSLDVSWEYHYWPNFGLRHQTTGSFTDDALPLLNINDNVNTYFQTDSQLITDLTLGGLVIRGRIDF